MSWIAAGVASAAITVKGIQAYKANKDKKKAEKEQAELLKNRPQYEIPSQYGENIRQATGVQSMYEPLTKTNALPGQAYMQNRIDANAANSVTQGISAGVTNPSQLTQLLAGANKTQQDAQIDLSLAGIENRNRNMGAFAQATEGVKNANLDLAGQEQFKWNQNVFSPYASAIGRTTQQIKDFTQRTRERTDSAIETGVATGSMVGSGVAGAKGGGSIGMSKEDRTQARFDRKVNRQNKRRGNWNENDITANDF